MRSLIVVMVCLGCAAVPTAALADIDPAGYTVSHQPQVGSCGNVWAKATVTRTWFTHRSSGSRDVWKVFYAGNFTTQAGPSPGACNAVGGVSVQAGLHGKIGGFATIRVQHPGGRTFNPLGVCQGSCSAAEFVQAFYPPVPRGQTTAPDTRPTSTFVPARRGFRSCVPSISICISPGIVRIGFPDPSLLGTSRQAARWLIVSVCENVRTESTPNRSEP